jgi:sugar lactone lactonase YvrE
MTRSVAALHLLLVVSAAGVRALPTAAEEAAAADGLRYPLAVSAAPDGGLVVADRLLPGVWRFLDGRGAPLFTGSKRFRTPLNAVRTVAVASDGRIYAGDSSTREVYSIAADGTASPLTGGRIGIPVDIAITSTNLLYVSDLETQRIWRLPAEGGEPVEVVALAAPRGLFCDAEDRLWAVAASGDEPLVRIGTDGALEPIVKTPVFEFPHDVAVDDGGTAYVSDNYARAIWRVPPRGEPEKWITGPPLAGPVGLAFHAGRLLVADPRARAVFEIGPDGSLRVVAGTPDSAVTREGR